MVKRLLVLLSLLVACKSSSQEQPPPPADETPAPTVQDVCLALKRTDFGCVSHYVTMQKSEATKYACAARCIVRDKKEAACASTCGVSAAPAVANDPMAVPQ